MEFGELMERRTAESGFMIHHYNNCLVITSGDKAFEEYGHHNRLLRSIEEVYARDIKIHGWREVGISSTTLGPLEKAWVIGKLMGIPVSEGAPSDRALANFRNLYREVGDKPSQQKRLVL